MNDFESLRAELHRIMRLKHDTHDFKLLNVGTDHRDEHHWRFRTKSGQIITLTVEVTE